VFRGSGVWSAYLCANVRRRGLRREGRLNCLSSYFVVFLARRACDYTLRRFCGRRSQTRRKCSFIKRPRTGRPRLATRQGPLSPSCKKDNTCENSVFVWAPVTLDLIHTAGVCVMSCSVAISSFLRHEVILGVWLGNTHPQCYSIRIGPCTFGETLHRRLSSLESIVLIVMVVGCHD